MNADNSAEMIGRTVFYTRLGIGVFDRRWWEFRIRLFGATTLPSVGRLCAAGAVWIIFVDEDMDPKMLGSFRALVHSVGLEHAVTFAPVQFYFDAFAELEKIASARFKDGQNVGLVRIDDDDALASDFLDRCHSQLLNGNYEPALITLSAGWEVSLADRKMRPIQLEFGSMNTFFYGPTTLIRSFAEVGHHRLQGWATKNGLRIVVDDSPRPSFMYMRHKQSDTSFGARRSAILSDPGCRSMTQASYEAFGIDHQKLLGWRQHAIAAPSTGRKKTWEISATMLGEASRLRKELQEVKNRLRDTTSDVFD